MIRVRATEKGFYENSYHKEGDEFLFDDENHVLGSWMEPLEEVKPKKVQKAASKAVEKDDVL